MKREATYHLNANNNDRNKNKKQKRSANGGSECNAPTAVTPDGGEVVTKTKERKKKYHIIHKVSRYIYITSDIEVVNTYLR